MRGSSPAGVLCHRGLKTHYAELAKKKPSSVKSRRGGQITDRALLGYSRKLLARVAGEPI